MVDKWKVEHEYNKQNNEVKLIETYIGEVPMEETNQQKYLGFIISSTGNNMKNINDKKNKSIGIIKKIFNKLDSLNLRKYFYECGIIFLNVMLRSSILYASETYYNLKETELRAIERIEENYLRQLLNTTRGCPISQLYLETGHQPARFEIFRRRLLFLKSILHEKQNSRIYQFVKLQYENPTKGDWMSSCLTALKYLDISLSINDIISLSVNQFKNILEKSIKRKSFEYLMEKIGSKGKEIRYSCLRMAEYLLPNDYLSISEKREIFSIRNRMVNIENNFKAKINQSACLCGQIEDMKHIYVCEIYENEKENVPYENIYEDDVRKMKKINERFQRNLIKRKQKLENENCSPRILYVDPLYNDNCTEMNYN